jgi:replicative DNA helicase
LKRVGDSAIIDSKLLEEKIVSYLIRDPIFYLKINDYLVTDNYDKKSYFTDKKFQCIVNLTHAFYNKYKRLPSKNDLHLLIEHNTKRNAEEKFYIDSAIELVYNMDFGDTSKEYIEDETVKFIKLARAVEATIQNQMDIQQGKFDCLDERIRTATNISVDKDLGTSIKDLDLNLEKMKISGDDTNTISLGLGDTLEKTIGRLRAGELFLFGAPPGIGKTIFIGNTAVQNFIQGKNVVVVTLETSTARLLGRFYQTIFNKKRMDIQNGLISEDDRDVIKRQKGDLIIKEYEANTVSSNDIDAFLQELYVSKGFKPDLICVDYVGIMLANDKKISSEEQYIMYKRVAEELRNLGKRHKVPVVSAVQMNRDSQAENGGGTKPVTGGKNIANSRGILDSTDYFTTLNIGNNDRNKFAEGVGLMRIFVDKNRNEKTGVLISYKVDFNTLQISEYVKQK